MFHRSNFKGTAIVMLLAVICATVASVPTSLLVQNSEMASNFKASNNGEQHFSNFKVKRSSNGSKESAAAAAAAALNKKSNPEIVPESFNAPSSASSSSKAANGINSAIAAAAAAAASQRGVEKQQQQQFAVEENGSSNGVASASLLRKRGINSQRYLYGAGGNAAGGAYYGYDYGNADELEPYAEMQDFEDYAPRAAATPYRSQAYDNLQNLLNSEAYLEPAAYPLRYPGRFYGNPAADRSKRSNWNALHKKVADLRLKRDTKLTPADMLALVALVEAGERARQGNEAAADGDGDGDAAADAKYLAYAEPYNSNQQHFSAPINSYYPVAYDYPPASNLDNVGDFNGGVWLQPAPLLDYYGAPYNVEALPQYELPARDHRYEPNNRFASNRFKVSNKKRSQLEKILTGVVAKPSFSYNSAKGEKYF